LLVKPKTCGGCLLENANGGFIISEGRCTTGVLIIGEAAGDKEKFYGLPFRPEAEAGSALMTAIRLLGKQREDFAFANLISCQPPYNNLEGASYEYAAIDHCKVHLNAIVNKYKPKVILALGNLPLKHLVKLPQEVIDYTSQLEATDKNQFKSYIKKFKIGSMRGYIQDSIYGIPLISSLHPSFVTREGRIYIGVLMRDIKAAIDLAAGNIPKFEVSYNENPSIKDAENFYELCRRNPDLIISHDIETPESTLQTDESEIEYENIEVRDIDSIQFSIKPKTGIFFPMFGEYEKIAEKILKLSNPKCGWNNYEFDSVHLDYKYGKGTINGLNIDVMHCWKWLNQDFVKMGRGLQFATNFYAPEFPVWKHLAQINPKNYGVLDVDATLRIYEGLKKDLSNKRLLPDTKSLWDGFIDDVVKLNPILLDMTKRGFPIDPIKREEFRLQIETEKDKVLSELQDEFPLYLRRLDPLEGYKRVPAEIIEIEELFKSASNFKSKGETPFYIVESPEIYNLRLAQYIEEHTRREKTTGLVLKGFIIDGLPEKRWVRMEEFKPNSSQQVANYLKHKSQEALKAGNKKLAIAYKVPTKRNRKTGEVSDTTSKDELYHLAEKLSELNYPDPFINKVVYSRELDHLAGTYIGRRTENKKTGKIKITGWQPDSDNRLRAKFQFIPSSGQLSTSPNIQNAPARGTLFSSTGYANLAKQFRSLVVAEGNKVLLEADYSAFHINTLSFEAEDKDYNRIGKIDPHSFLAAHIISDYIDLRVHKLKQTKPIKLTDEQWKARILIGEETIERLKNLHSWVDLDDVKLAEHLKFIKKNYKFIRDSQAKPALLGLGFGMGVKKFYKTNRHTFKNEVEPKRIHQLVRQLFPKTFIEFPERIKKQADRQTYLISRYGYIRRFYDVYDWRLLTSPRAPKGDEEIIKNSRGQYWCRKSGVDSEACIAYLPSNHAFAIKKEKMRELSQFNKDGIITDLNEKYGLINEIHDSLIFEIEESLVEEATKIIKRTMESPAQYLKNSLFPNGLTTSVEIKIGKNWAPFNDTPSKGPINLDGMKDYIL